MLSRCAGTVLCLLAAAGCAGTAVPGPPPAPVARRARSDERLPLVMTIASDKAEYVVGETITFTVTIANPGAAPVAYFDKPDIMGFFNPGWFDLLDYSPLDESMWQGDVRLTCFEEPDGTRHRLVGFIPVGPMSENTGDAPFVTIRPGGALVRTEAVPAKVAGRWRVAAELDSRQNYHVREHHPSCCGSATYSFPVSDPAEIARRAAAAERFRLEQLERERRLEREGWRWNEESDWREKVEPGVSLGTARSNEIVVAVRPAADEAPE